MKHKPYLLIIIAGIWISISEFIRNEIFLKSYWVNHYENLGLHFPSEPLNGAVWGVWSFLFAFGIFLVAKKFDFKETLFISWFFAFVLMWFVIGNMGVLPFEILFYAVPLSLLETVVAVWIIKGFTFR